jgi:hypothetical protein
MYCFRMPPTARRAALWYAQAERDFQCWLEAGGLHRLGGDQAARMRATAATNENDGLRRRFLPD